MTDRRPRPRPYNAIPTPNGANPELTIQPARASRPLPPTPQDLQQERDSEFRTQQEDFFEQLTKHYSPYEGYDSLISTFEKTTNGSVQATFREGTRLAHTRDEAIKPKVGLTFLAGANTPQVNRMEDISMTQQTPDQKDASWRVMTAGTLLVNFTVGEDMTMSFSDNTPAVVHSYRKRMGSDGPFVDPNIGTKALAVRRSADKFVTIDSNDVHVVNDLSSDNWDLEGLLIEVDSSSLMDLVSNYQRVISRGGPDLPAAETVTYLPPSKLRS